MAREESDREDLLREAVALSPRAEFTFSGRSEPVFAGFKRTGGLSVYFGADPVYQFDAAGGLRRGYVDGLLYRTQGTTLARLRRERTETETILFRHDLTPEELAAFLERMRGELTSLRDELQAAAYTSVATVPAGSDAAAQVVAALDVVLDAEAPLAAAIKGRR